MRRFAIRDGVRVRTNFLLREIIELTDWTDEEIDKLADMKPGESWHVGEGAEKFHVTRIL